jgi:hypothetical protein
VVTSKIIRWESVMERRCDGEEEGITKKKGTEEEGQEKS